MKYNDSILLKEQNTCDKIWKYSWPLNIVGQDTTPHPNSLNIFTPQNITTKSLLFPKSLTDNLVG